MPRRDEVLAAMRDALILQDPEWDITPGTAEYKILEAVSQQIENITYNSVLNDYHFDVDKKSGFELDLFMSLFGFARIKAKRATGEVTFSRGTPAAQDYFIPSGTQVFVPATAQSPAIYFQTTITTVLPQGATEVSVPVQSVVGGTIGNVPSASVTGIATSVGGVTAVNNAQSITGGRDSETDTDLRDRWKRSVFRNISGTEDQFLGLAFNESAFITRANLIGPIERYTEQVQLSEPEDLTTASPWQSTITADITSSATSFSVAVGTGVNFSTTADGPFYAALWSAGNFKEIIKVTNRTVDAFTVVRAFSNPLSSGYDPPAGVTIREVFPSSVPDSAFTFAPGGEIVGLDIGLTSQQVGRRGTDYEFITNSDNGVKWAEGVVFPCLYVYAVGATNFGLGSIVEMEHEYTPNASRNDPGTSPYVADKVDLFVDGEDPITVTEQVPMRRTGSVFGADYTSADFIRDDGIHPPASGNYYTPLSKAPIISIPDSITVAATATTDATTYFKDEDYWLASDETGVENSPRASNGIEWKVPSTAPADLFSITRQGPGVGGKLDGWYAYAFTFETDGVETLIGTDGPESPGAANDAASHGKNDIVIPVNGGGGTVKWRKIYRSFTATSEVNALAGPFYLLAVIKNNTTTGYADNKRDDALLPIQPPKNPPPVDAPLSVEYNYNGLIERLDAQMDLVRLVGMDTLAHAADAIDLKFNLAVVLVPGMNITDVKADVETNLFAWMNRKDFRNNVQVSDVIDVVSNASGIDNVRLVRSTEARSDVQKVTVIPTATPDANRDTFTIKIGDDTSGLLAYNESPSVVREILEAMPTIHEGNTYATQLNGAITSSDTIIIVDDNPGLHVGGNGGNPPLQTFYIQVDDEVIYVPEVTDLGATLQLGTLVTAPVRRAQLGSAAASHLDNTDVHVLGDISVSRTGAGTPGNPYIYTLSFLSNYFTGDNDWGTRDLNLVIAAKGSDASRLTFAVAKKQSGVGSGIEHIAANGQTIITSYAQDFYLSSDELPSLFGVDLLVRAQNTFGAP